VIGQSQGFCRHEQDGLDFYRSFGVGSRRSIAFSRDGVAISAQSLWSVGWDAIRGCVWLVIGSSGGAITCSSNAGCPALLVGSLLVGSAVFIYWELARSEQREKLALRV